LSDSHRYLRCSIAGENEARAARRGDAKNRENGATWRPAWYCGRLFLMGTLSRARSPRRAAPSPRARQARQAGRRTLAADARKKSGAARRKPVRSRVVACHFRRRASRAARAAA
jgi:hypothetical protein